MENNMDVLLSPMSNEREKQKARRALFRAFLGDFAKEMEKENNAKPKAVRGQKKQ